MVHNSMSTYVCTVCLCEDEWRHTRAHTQGPQVKPVPVCKQSPAPSGFLTCAALLLWPALRLQFCNRWSLLCLWWSHTPCTHPTYVVIINYHSLTRHWAPPKLPLNWGTPPYIRWDNYVLPSSVDRFNSWFEWLAARFESHQVLHGLMRERSHLQSPCQLRLGPHVGSCFSGTLTGNLGPNSYRLLSCTHRMHQGDPKTRPTYVCIAGHHYGQVSTLVRKRSTHDVTKASARNRLATKASIGSEWRGNDKQVTIHSHVH